MKNRLFVGALCALLLITSKTKPSYETVGPYIPYAVVSAILLSEGVLNLPVNAIGCWNKKNKTFKNESFATKVGVSTGCMLASAFILAELLPRASFFKHENIIQTIGDSKNLSIASCWIGAGVFFTHFMARSLHAGKKLFDGYKYIKRTEHRVYKEENSSDDE